jgi:L-fuconolactonase
VIIDAHQHFWQLSRGDYDWLSPNLETLYRDFMPKDLEPLLLQKNVSGTVLVQAAPTLNETEFLLKIAETTDFVMGVVGWVDFTSPKAGQEIARLAENPKLVGLRPMIQDIDNLDWMLRDDLAPAFKAMIAHGLVFDALVLPKHLTRLNTLLLRHPDLKVVIDHGAKPNIANDGLEQWARDISTLAQIDHVHCKLSGLLTEAGNDWTQDDLAPYISHLFEAFGTDRLIWGSDWPVLTLAGNYAQWFEIADAYAKDKNERNAIFGSNAVRLYNLD